MNSPLRSFLSAPFLFSALVGLATTGCFIQSGDDDETDPDGSETGGGDADGGSSSGGAGSGGGNQGGGTCATDSSACSTEYVESDWSLAEREQWTDLLTELEQHINLMNERCESSIPGTFAYETFRGKLEGSPFVSIMNSGVFEVQQLCLDSEAGKLAVQAEISQIVIVHAGDSRSHSLVTGRLSIVLDPEMNPSEWADVFAEWLGSAL